MDGYELARRAARPSGHATPLLIALTGYGQEQTGAAARGAGFDAHLVKPVDARTIINLVDSLARG